MEESAAMEKCCTRNRKRGTKKSKKAENSEGWIWPTVGVLYDQAKREDRNFVVYCSLFVSLVKFAAYYQQRRSKVDVDRR